MAGSSEDLPNLQKLETDAVAKTLPAILKGLFATPTLPKQNNPADYDYNYDMEAGMKEDIKKQLGYTKTKEVSLFDEGLSERQSAFIVVARPILAALSALDGVGGDIERDNVDPDSIMLLFY